MHAWMLWQTVTMSTMCVAMGSGRRMHAWHATPILACTQCVLPYCRSAQMQT